MARRPPPQCSLTRRSATSSTGATRRRPTTSALQEFNRLSRTLKLGVTLIQSTTPPERNGLGGASVNFDTLSGTVNDRVLGARFSAQIIGTGLSGVTQTAKWQTGQGLRQIKAFVYVPSTPTINALRPAGGQFKQDLREVGDGVKMCIAIHEFIHACGLSNDDHSPVTDPDMFIAQPQPRAGPTPSQDKLELRLQPLVTAPPIALTARTAGLIRGIW